MQLFGAKPLFLHIGEDSPETHKKLQDALNDSDFVGVTPDYQVISGQAVEGLIHAARKARADLIIAGALRKEGIFKTSLSKVARQLATKAPCSVFLLLDVHETPPPLEKIHCVVEYHRPAHMAVQVSLSLAAMAGTRDLVFTHSFQFPKEVSDKTLVSQASGIRKLYHQQDTKLHRFLSRFRFEGVQFRGQCICEKTHDSTLAFTREWAANLLVLPAPKKSQGLWSTLFTTDIERLLHNIPCSILLTRKASYR